MTDISRRKFVGAAGGALAAASIPAGAAQASERFATPIAEGLTFTDGRELARMVRSGDLSAEELMRATLEQIQRVNGALNAIPTLKTPDDLMAEAREADRRMARGEARGALHGIPIAVKDLANVAGMRSTSGSPILADFVPDQDAIFVERYRAAGAIIIGKTNVPEFGAGSHTFNPVFGPTHNPYDLSKSCGGSSGGAAVGLASGMIPFADGSDLGGSLRNPASFCNVVGFRPSPGRVPDQGLQAWNTMPVLGPMGRTVSDVAYLASVMFGPDPRDPISLDEPGAAFLAPLGRDFRGVKVAWSRDLGRYPVDPAVTAVCDAARPVFEELGMIVEDGEPDLRDADEVFQVLRGWMFASGLGEFYRTRRSDLKDTVIWNIERGLNLTAQDIADVEVKRTALYHRVMSFLDDYEYLILPVSQVPPFPIEWDWVHEINDVRMETYIDWMATCSAITNTGLPSISVPAGFTPDGLPIGLQIVGRHHADRGVMQIAYAFEQATQVGKRRPEIAV
jgi:amidase